MHAWLLLLQKCHVPRQRLSNSVSFDGLLSPAALYPDKAATRANKRAYKKALKQCPAIAKRRLEKEWAKEGKKGWAKLLRKKK